jgi:hypothetical protein
MRKIRREKKNQLKEVRGNRSDLKEVGKSVTTLFFLNLILNKGNEF